MAEDEARPKVAPSESLADLLTRIKTPSAGTSDALAEAAERTARTGRSLSELLTALKAPPPPPLVIPDVQVRTNQIDLDDLPAVRTARATEDMVDRLGDYQGEVTGLVQLLQAQADEQRERADRAERQQKKMYRVALCGVAVGVLGLIGGIVGPLFA